MKSTKKYGGDNMIRHKLISFGTEQCEPCKAPTSCITTFYMLHFVLSGSGYFCGTRLSAGQGFLCRLGKYVTYKPDEKDPWNYAWINFTDTEILEELGRIILPQNSDIFTFDTQKPYGKLISDAQNVHVKNGADFSYLGSALLYSLLSYLYNDSHRLTVGNEKSSKELHVERAKQLIESEFNNPDFTISYLSSRLGIDRAYLRSIFCQSCGVSPKEYLTQIRMAHAREFLVSTAMPINIVAQSVGYKDALWFSKMFKKLYTGTPTEYRIKHGLDAGKI